MPNHRPTFFALAVLFTAAMTSAASAGCCGWGTQAPMVYAPTGCGGCGTPSAAIVYAQPVAPAPPPVVVAAPVWGTGCGCRAAVVYAAPALEPTPIAPAPVYVVNQGPDYVGPGIMVPYHTWSPNAGYAEPGAYPYRHGYWHSRVHRYHAPARRVAYRERVHAHWHMLRPLPAWHANSHRRHY